MRGDGPCSGRRCVSGCSGPSDHRVAAVEPEGDPARPAFALARHLDRAEGGGIDLDLELLDRRDEHVAAVGLAPQDGGEQPDHRRTADRRALVIPGAVAGDPHLANGRSARGFQWSTGGSWRSSIKRLELGQAEAVKLDRGPGFGHALVIVIASATKQSSLRHWIASHCVSQ